MSGNNYMTMGTAVGTAVGIFVGLIICIFVFKAMNKDGKMKTKYDEMQILVRGKAYQYAFWTMMGLEALMLVLDSGNIQLPWEGFISHLIIILIAVLVQVSYSIWNDGYIGLNTNMGRFGVFAVCISLFNFLVAGGAIANGKMVVDGRLQTPAANLFCGVLFIIIGIEIFLKKVADNGQKED